MGHVPSQGSGATVGHCQSQLAERDEGLTLQLAAKPWSWPLRRRRLGPGEIRLSQMQDASSTFVFRSTTAALTGDAERNLSGRPLSCSCRRLASFPPSKCSSESSKSALAAWAAGTTCTGCLRTGALVEFLSVNLGCSTETSCSSENGFSAPALRSLASFAEISSWDIPLRSKVFRKRRASFNALRFAWYSASSLAAASRAFCMAIPSLIRFVILSNFIARIPQTSFDCRAICFKTYRSKSCIGIVHRMTSSRLSERKGLRRKCRNWGGGVPLYPAPTK
mmetsp:Transcript_63885/g.147085  ORF Transcript_63885/g.147085 Transcript_63885/m.147085 type:complete len:279 (-) Transcript_63885:945-1781(-)